MKKIFALLTILFCMDSVSAQELNPVAHPDAVVNAGKARFTVLTPEMIRIQYSDRAFFEDRATFAIVNRRLPVPAFVFLLDGADGLFVHRRRPSEAIAHPLCI